uniref:RNA-binding protein n=1 Tax=Solanum tuberosum TaxID=4113 RepID=M1CUC7_SOLTU
MLGFRANFDIAGGGGIPSLSVRDPLASTHGLELAPNGRAMRGGDTLILGFVDFIDPACATITLTALQGDFLLNDNNPLSNLH